MDAIWQVLLHPVRWGIVQQLAQQPATPAELSRSLADTPQATLYRQIQALLDAGLVQVVEETQVRGAKERTYALAGILDGPDSTPEGRRRQALLLLGLLQHDVLAALDGNSPEAAGHRTTTTRSRLYATPQELETFYAALEQAVQPLLEPHPGATPVTIGLVVTPTHSGSTHSSHSERGDQ